jgi:hypothetical protein
MLRSEEVPSFRNTEVSRPCQRVAAPTVAGALYHFTPDTQAGFALGGTGSSLDIANDFGGGRADAFNAAAYARHKFGAAYVPDCAVIPGRTPPQTAP